MNKRMKQNEKGFTMIELIVVVALMAIIGAVLVPMFSKMSVKARLTSDISSIKTFQRQIDIYKTEQNTYPGGITAAAGAADVSGTVGGDLVAKEYIDAKDLIKVGATTSYNLKLQTGGKLRVSGGSIYLLTTEPDYKVLIDAFTDEDGNKGWAKTAE